MLLLLDYHLNPKIKSYYGESIMQAFQSMKETVKQWHIKTY